MRKELTAEQKRKADRRETCSITINLLELLGMVVTAWVMLELVGDGADVMSDPLLMRGDNTAAVSLFSRCGGGGTNKHAYSQEYSDVLKHSAKHIPRVRNTLADSIFRRPRVILADKVRELTKSDDWSEQNVETRSKEISDIVLQTKNILSEHDDCPWGIMSAQPG